MNIRVLEEIIHQSCDNHLQTIRFHVRQCDRLVPAAASFLLLNPKIRRKVFISYNIFNHSVVQLFYWIFFIPANTGAVPVWIIEKIAVSE